MAWDKIWIGTTGDYSLYTNWTKISVRTSAYSWTASGSGTNEYYLRTSGGSNPAIGGSPGGVYINGSLATSGTVGTLAAGRWAYGDNDALGYSTIYVRLSDGTDPDSKAADYVQFQSIPTAADNVRIPRDGGAISSGLSQSGVAINAFIVEDGYANTIGSASGYLVIDPDSFQFSGTGAAYIDVGSAATALDVRNTATVATGYFGLYLKGTAITVLSVTKGSVGIAMQAGETSTITDAVRAAGNQAVISIGSGVTMSGTTLDVISGAVVSFANLITANLEGGTLTTYGSGTLTTGNIKGGTFYPNGSGTITTINVGRSAGVVDFTQSGIDITVTNMNVYKGGSFKANPLRVTFTNDVVVQDVSTVTAS